jgi:hypothetical protein
MPDTESPGTEAERERDRAIAVLREHIAALRGEGDKVADSQRTLQRFFVIGLAAVVSITNKPTAADVVNFLPFVMLAILGAVGWVAIENALQFRLGRSIWIAERKLSALIQPPRTGWAESAILSHEDMIWRWRANLGNKWVGRVVITLGAFVFAVSEWLFVAESKLTAAPVTKVLVATVAVLLLMWTMLAMLRAFDEIASFTAMRVVWQTDRDLPNPPEFVLIPTTPRP